MCTSSSFPFHSQ